MPEEKDNTDDDRASDSVIGFPQSRTRVVQSKEGTRDLGISKLAQRLGGIQPNLKGHWCSCCKGIWYGYVGECECPVCGNRHG